MSENTNKDFFKKIQKRAERSLKVEEVNLNSELYSEAIEYLKKQKYIKFHCTSRVIFSLVQQEFNIQAVLTERRTVFSFLAQNLLCVLGCHGSRRKGPRQSDQKYICCFLYMTQIPPKNIVLVEQILQKSKKLAKI